jgi:Iap family predicted aminopeptidase
VRGELAALGYRVALRPFALPRGGRSRNVVARSAGPPRVLVTAHLDGVRAGPAANDNGSGVAALVEVARALRGRPGVVLAALGAEERVVTGSRRHLGALALLGDLPRAQRRGLRLVVNLDMVGVGARLHVRGLARRPARAAALLLDRARALRLPATYLADPSGQSDHAELTRAGLPAAWLEWRRDPCWHSACDRAGRVSAWRVAAAARLAVAGLRAALAPAGLRSGAALPPAGLRSGAVLLPAPQPSSQRCPLQGSRPLSTPGAGGGSGSPA